MVPAPSPILLREGYISEDEAKLAVAGEHSPDVVKGFGAYVPYMWPSELLMATLRRSFAEYVRARVKYVHTHKSTQRAEDEVFRVKNLQIQDSYV